MKLQEVRNSPRDQIAPQMVVLEKKNLFTMKSKTKAAPTNNKQLLFFPSDKIDKNWKQFPLGGPAVKLTC